MKTRYTSLVGIKKSIMQKSEGELRSANEVLHNASKALQSSNESLLEIETPLAGEMPKFLASRTLLDTQRDLITHNEEWVAFAKKDINLAKEQLKLDTMEYEKFNYLELQEIKEQLKIGRILEAKELDEVAIMTYTKRKKEAS